MSTTTNPTTADELWQMADEPLELLRGKLVEVMSPPGDVHADLMMRLSWIVFSYVREKKLGKGYTELGFLLSRNPDTVLAPDVAYLSNAKYETLQRPRNWLPIAPDIAFEIISVHDTYQAVAAKASEYLGFGVPLVIVVNPRKRMLHVHRPGEAVVDIAEGSLFDCSEVAPGLTIDTGILFEDIDSD